MAALTSVLLCVGTAHAQDAPGADAGAQDGSGERRRNVDATTPATGAGVGTAPPLSAGALNASGWQLLGAGRHELALELFDAALAQRPDLADALVGKGEVLFWRGQHARALAHYERAVALNPAQAHAHNGIGHARLNLARATPSFPRTRSEHLRASRAAFERALRLEPDHAGARDGAREVARALGAPGAATRILQIGVFGLLLSLTLMAMRRLARDPRWLRDALLAIAPAYVVSRAIVLLSLQLAPALVAEARSHPMPYLRHPDSAMLDAVAGRWDANLYASVMLGYRTTGPGGADGWGNVGQFPLLPMLVDALAWALDDTHLAALLVPHLALLVAALAFYRLLERTAGRGDARRGTWVLLLLPGSFYGSVLYAEALGLCFCLVAYMAARDRRWVTCLLAGILAGLARPNALPLVVALGVLALTGERSPRERVVAAGSALGAAVGVATFMLFTWAAFGDPLAYSHEMQANRLGGPSALAGALQLTGLLPAPPADAFQILAGLLGLASLALAATAGIDLLKKRELPEAALVLSGLLMGLPSVLSSQFRYHYLLFPIAGWLGHRLPAGRGAWATALAALCVLSLLALGFARWRYLP